MLKILLLLVLAIASSGTLPAVAATLAYEFDFHTPVGSAPQSFFYESDGPTAPGTGLSGVQSLPDVGTLFPLVASRGFDGDWSFTGMGSPTYVFTWETQIGLSFPNLPGFYASEPALLTSQVMFVVTQTPGTVDITIQSVPEPAMSLLVLTVLVCMIRRPGTVAGNRVILIELLSPKVQCGQVARSDC